MKTCAYCGQENADAAVTCAGCGTDEFKTAASPSTDGGSKREEFVTVQEFQSLEEADVAVSSLDAAGIETFMPDENMVHTLNLNLAAFGFVRVQVHRKDLASAKALLSAPPQNNPTAD